MKRIIYACIAVACLTTAVSCTNDATTNEVINDGKAEVSFSLKSDKKISAVTRANGVITEDGFRLHAFRKNHTTGDFQLYKEMDLSGMDYSGDQLTGTLRLDAGTYKFVPSYGLTGSYNNWLNITDGAVLGNDMYITHMPLLSVPEIFQEHTPVDQLTEWDIKLDGTTQTVTTTMFRSVGRVDVIFVGAQRVNGEIVTDPSKDPLGGYETKSLVFDFAGVSPRMNLVGEIPAADMRQAHKFNHGQPGSGVIMGLGTYANSILDGYTQLDNITANNVPQGSAYFVGPYLLPQYGSDNVVNATVTISNNDPLGVRIITVADPIPVEQNKVTIITVWVLSDHIYSAEFEFVATVDTVWEGSNIIDGGVIEE